MIDRDLINFYIPFDTYDLMELFPSINFTLFTEFEMLISTILFNIFFIVFMILIIYVFLKCIYKVCSWIF